MNWTERTLYEFLQVWVEDLTLYPDQYNRCDCFSAKHALEVELKCREVHYHALLIEKEKYEALRERAKKNNRRPIYANTTPAGVWVWDLNTTTEPLWEVREMPRTTQWENEKVDKVVGFLKVTNAKQLG